MRIIPGVQREVGHGATVGRGRGRPRVNSENSPQHRRRMVATRDIIRIAPIMLVYENSYGFTKHLKVIVNPRTLAVAFIVYYNTWPRFKSTSLDEAIAFYNSITEPVELSGDPIEVPKQEKRRHGTSRGQQRRAG